MIIIPAMSILFYKFTDSRDLDEFVQMFFAVNPHLCIISHANLPAITRVFASHMDGWQAGIQLFGDYILINNLLHIQDLKNEKKVVTTNYFGAYRFCIQQIAVKNFTEYTKIATNIANMLPADKMTISIVLVYGPNVHQYPVITGFNIPYIHKDHICRQNGIIEHLILTRAHFTAVAVPLSDSIMRVDFTSTTADYLPGVPMADYPPGVPMEDYPLVDYPPGMPMAMKTELTNDNMLMSPNLSAHAGKRKELPDDEYLFD